MKTMSNTLFGSLLAATLIVGVAIGYALTPTYQQTMYQKEAMNLGPSDRNLDLRYLNQMGSHHWGAILLAQQVQDKTQRPEIKALALEIQANEPKLIEELLAWKLEWYGDRRAITKPQAVNLGPADNKVDLRFLNALIAHHEAGIVMTQEVRGKSSRAEVLNNADQVEDFLKTSLGKLREMRSEWYGLN